MSTMVENGDSNLKKNVILVVGAAVLDIVVKPTTPSKAAYNAASCVECDGGVARNIADVVGRLGGAPVLLYSAMGQDARGAAMLGRLQDPKGNKWWSPESICQVPGSNTASFLAIMDSDGTFSTAYMDMAVLSHIPVPSQAVIDNAAILVVDSNPTPVNLETALRRAEQAGAPVLWDPTSGPKATALLLAMKEDGFDFLGHLTFATPNLDELFVLAGRESTCDSNAVTYATASNQELIHNLSREVLLKMHPQGSLIVTMGSEGVLLASKGACNDSVAFQHFPATNTTGIVVRNDTGAGDSFVGAFVCALLRGGNTAVEAIPVGMAAALVSIQCEYHTISPDLSSIGTQQL